MTREKPSVHHALRIPNLLSYGVYLSAKGYLVLKHHISCVLLSMLILTLSFLDLLSLFLLTFSVEYVCPGF